MIATAGTTATGASRWSVARRRTPRHFVHLRHFAPANGIPEDPVTGTAHAAAAVYLDGKVCCRLASGWSSLESRDMPSIAKGVVTVEVLRLDGRI